MNNNYLQNNDWFSINSELKRFDSISKYIEKVEEITYNCLRDIFMKEKIKRMKEENRNVIYDYSIETKNQRIFCEIKFDKLNLHYFWEKYVSELSKVLEKRNKNSWRRHFLKYLLILVESRDSTKKMNLKPLFPNILVINLKSLLKIRNSVIEGSNRKLIYLLIDNSFGVLYDEFIEIFPKIINKNKNFELIYEDLSSIKYNHKILNIDLEKYKEDLFRDFEKY